MSITEIAYDIYIFVNSNAEGQNDFCNDYELL